MIFDKYKVIYHAHMIESTVALIDCFKTTAWEITALITEPDKPFTQKFAMFAHVCTVLAAWSATSTIRLMKTLLFQVVLHCQVVGTYTTVHSAGSNKFFTHIL
jgi:hypothetical protein